MLFRASFQKCLLLRPGLKQPQQQYRSFFSVFKTFVENVKKEAKKDTEFQTGLQSMEKQVTDIKDNRFVKEIRNAVNSESIKKMDKAFRQKRGKVGEQVLDALTVDPESTTYKAAKAVADSKVTQKIVEKAQDVLNIDGNERFGGFYNRELREKIKEERKEKFQLQLEAKKMEEERLLAAQQENASTEMITVKKPKKWSASMQDLWESSVVGRKMKNLSESYETSDNVFMYFSRGIIDGVKEMFQESEQGRVQRLLIQYDPNFTEDAFLKEARDYIIPEIIESYTNMNIPAMSHWFGEAAMAVAQAHIKTNPVSKGFESRIINISNVQIYSYQMVDDIPIVVVYCIVQQIESDAASKLEQKIDPEIQSVVYTLALGREETVTDPVNNGWRLIQMGSQVNREY